MKLATAFGLALFTFLATPLAGSPQQTKQPLLARAGSKSPTRIMTWTVDGITRKAIVCLPQQATTNNRTEGHIEDSKLRPLVFGFHGHGGNAERMVDRYGFQKRWSEAVVVYPQGLKTPGKTDPEGKKPGWQKFAGDQNDRDLKFFDAMVKTMLEQHHVDPEQIYSSGHSNGAGFSYLLLAARNSRIAAVAVSAGGSRALRTLKNQTPRPVLHIAGRNDQIVPFRAQEQTLERIRQHNHCLEKPVETRQRGLLYKSKSGKADIEFWPHDGTHRYPEKAPALIIRFLKQVANSSRRSASNDHSRDQ